MEVCNLLIIFGIFILAGLISLINIKKNNYRYFSALMQTIGISLSILFTLIIFNIDKDIRNMFKDNVLIICLSISISFFLIGYYFNLFFKNTKNKETRNKYVKIYISLIILIPIIFEIYLFYYNIKYSKDISLNIINIIIPSGLFFFGLIITLLPQKIVLTDKHFYETTNKKIPLIIDEILKIIISEFDFPENKFKRKNKKKSIKPKYNIIINKTFLLFILIIIFPFWIMINFGYLIIMNEFTNTLNYIILSFIINIFILLIGAYIIIISIHFVQSLLINLLNEDLKDYIIIIAKPYIKIIAKYYKIFKRKQISINNNKTLLKEE